MRAIIFLLTPIKLVRRESQQMKFLWKKHVVSSFVTALALFAASFLGIAPAWAADHGQLVIESPRLNLPIVLDGEVRAHALVGDRIFVGGDFQQVQRPDGTTITQPNIFAYDINTGLVDENFRPAVNNSVWALEVNPRGDTLYAGGRFTTWDGAVVERVAKVDAFGNRDTSFQASASAGVLGLAVTNDDVYLAGNFFFVGGAFHAGFAAVDANTGAVDPDFEFNVENSAATGQLARGVVVTSDGNSVFGLHFGTSINGNPREAIVKIDTLGGTAGLADWQVDWSGQANRRVCLKSLRDIAIAPDDSFIVIGGQGADNPPNCDSVLRYPTDGTGVIGFDWSARMYSSVTSVGVSDTAVYAGGHFCAAPLNGADPVTRQTHERTNGVANRCNVRDPNDPVNPSMIFPNDAVFRKTLAALDPSDGRALAWDPGSNADFGTLDLTVIDRGLLAGMDNDRYGNFIFTGRSGFFDFGGFTPPAPPPPDPVVAACMVEVINNVPVVSYSDFPNVPTVNILRNGGWIATHTSETPGAGTYEDTSAVPGVAYSYVIRSRPGGGVVNDVACSAVNAAPVANADTASTLQDTAVTINVTANDSDANGDTLVLDDVTAAANGTAVIVGDNILYTPAGGFSGTDTFSYKINDGNGGEATAAVTVTVTEVITNQPPVAEDDTGSMPQDSTATFNVLENDVDPDGDALTLTISSPPAAAVGSATVVNGEIQFVPAAGSTETGVIGYTIDDGNGGTDTATLTVTVTAPNQPPVAEDDTGTMEQDSTATFDVQSNDSDPDGDPLTLTISSPPAAAVGTATVVPGGIQFVPAAGSTATGVIGYTIDDGNGGTDTATLTVTVTAAMSCSVSVNANNVPVVSYSDFPNVPNVNIRRNDRWIATHTSVTPGTGTYEDTAAVSGVDYSYVIRSRPGGDVVNDVACSPATFAF